MTRTHLFCALVISVTVATAMSAGDVSAQRRVKPYAPPPQRPPVIASPKAETARPEFFSGLGKKGERPSESSPRAVENANAATGRISNQRDLFNAEWRGAKVLDAEYEQISEQIRRSRSFFYLTPGEYRSRRWPHAEKAWRKDVETALLKEAPDRGLALVSGRWSDGTNFVRVFGVEPKWHADAIAFLEPSWVPEAALFVPYVAGKRTFFTGAGPLLGPILGISADLFSSPRSAGAPGAPIEFHDIAVDRRVDLRIFEEGENGTSLHRAENRLLIHDSGKAPEPATMLKLLGCCVFVRPPLYAQQYATLLRSLSFDANRVRIAVMVHDSATRDMLKTDRFLASQRRSDAIPKNQVDLEAWVVQQLRRSRGDSLLLLAHVEGQDYVLRNAEGTELGRVSVTRVNALAFQHNVTLFNLGCKTAEVLNGLDGVGVYNAFNSVQMLKTVSKALQGRPPTVAGFLERLGAPEANIVVPASLLAQPEVWSRLQEAKDPAGRPLVEGNRLRMPPMRVVVSPTGYVGDHLAGMSVLLSSNWMNHDGHYPVVAELSVVTRPCATLSALKRAELLEDKTLSCADYRAGVFSQAPTTLYGHPERRFR